MTFYPDKRCTLSFAKAGFRADAFNSHWLQDYYHILIDEPSRGDRFETCSKQLRLWSFTKIDCRDDLVEWLWNIHKGFAAERPHSQNDLKDQLKL